MLKDELFVLSACDGSLIGLDEKTLIQPQTKASCP